MTPDCPTCRQRAEQVASLAHTAATRRTAVETATAAAEQQAIEMRALRAANARLVADLAETAVALGDMRVDRDRYRRVVEDGVAELARSWRCA